MTFKLALVQQHVRGGDKRHNLAHALDMIADAVGAGAEVIVLPETMTLGWTHPSTAAQSDEIPDGPSCRTLRDAARRHRVFVCAGIAERAADQVYNAAVLIDPDGNVILHHRKINELEIGHAFYALGDRLGVAHTSLGTFGLMICADGFARGQVVSRTLGYMGAQVILSPCAWAVSADHDNAKEPYGTLWLENYCPVARDFQMWIAGVSNVGWIDAGPWNGRKCIGSSLVIGPTGERVLQGPYGVDAEQCLYVEVRPSERPVQGEGWSRVWGH